MATMTSTDELTVELQSRLRGEVLDTDHPEYEEARKLYNAMIDKRPRLIARCSDAADVTQAVGFARESGIDLAIRGGGHNGPAWAAWTTG
jgi:FAD/FMN-containing dehydrogenase